MLDISNNSDRNISIGNMSLSTGKVLDNIAIGNKALARENIPTGSTLLTEITGNIAIGTESLYQDICGNHNVAIGYKTLHENHNGKNNIAIGQEALFHAGLGFLELVILVAWLTNRNGIKLPFVNTIGTVFTGFEYLLISRVRILLGRQSNRWDQHTDTRELMSRN